MVMATRLDLGLALGKSSRLLLFSCGLTFITKLRRILYNNCSFLMRVCALCSAIK